MPIADIFQFIQDGQRLFRETIVDSFQIIKSQGSIYSSFSLIIAGFLYGVFHALGPGHGKVIISGYLLANEHSLKRGLLIVALSSLMQAVVAIILVVSFFYILNLARAQAEYATAVLEITSYTILSLIGFRLMWRGLKEIYKSSQHHPHHMHDGTCCGHSHATPVMKTQNENKLDFLSIILSVGIRPCSGAVLLLFLACMLGIVLPGIFATLAMALGTALTTGLLAVITVKSKNVILDMFSKSDKPMHLMHGGLSIICGLLVIVMCGLFLSVAIGGLQSPSQNMPGKTQLPLMHLPNSTQPGNAQ